MIKLKIIGEIFFSKELIKSELNGKIIVEMYFNLNLYNNFLELLEKILSN